MFVKKWPLEYQNVIKSYLPTYLWDSSNSSDICDCSDRFESSDSSVGSDIGDSSYSSVTNFVTDILWLKFCDKNCVTKIVWQKLCD